MIDSLEITKGTTMPTRLQPDQCISHRENAEEEHHQEQDQVEVVVTDLEDSLMRHIGDQHCPALDVEYQHQLDKIEERQPWGHEQAHPYHACL